MPEDLGNIAERVRASLVDSLERLGLQQVQLLQLHNAVTTRRGDLPTSLAVSDVLGKGGVVDAFDALRREGLVHACGFTGLGDVASLQQLIQCRYFTSAQVPAESANTVGRGRSIGGFRRRGLPPAS